jgi:hypothetical protein
MQRRFHVCRNMEQPAVTLAALDGMRMAAMLIKRDFN